MQFHFFFEGTQIWSKDCITMKLISSSRAAESWPSGEINADASGVTLGEWRREGHTGTNMILVTFSAYFSQPENWNQFKIKFCVDVHRATAQMQSSLHQLWPPILTQLYKKQVISLLDSPWRFTLCLDSTSSLEFPQEVNKHTKDNHHLCQLQRPKLFWTFRAIDKLDVKNRHATIICEFQARRLHLWCSSNCDVCI